MGTISEVLEIMLLLDYIAIIQKLWNTAWDLTTHWNVELIAI